MFRFILTGLVVLLIPLAAAAQPACTLLWDPPTTFTTGEPLNRPLDYFRVYQSATADFASVGTLDVPGTQATAVVPCAGWNYYRVTALICDAPATHAGCEESGPSNTVTVKKPPGPPRNARQGG